MIKRIVSGGQTGSDRAALDFAIERGIEHGGWCPPGRPAEDGPIPERYRLRELPAGGYLQRTERNVIDSDATLILNLGKLEGGTLATLRFAEQLGKPHLLVLLDQGVREEALNQVREWLQNRPVETLNVAGPRESKWPGIYRLTYDLLEGVF